MAYSFQTVASSSVLTASIYNQTEVNIRDQYHGLNGVAKTGISFSRTAKTAAFSPALSDIGGLFDCSGGPYSITFVSAATLGAGWSANYTNTSSGRILLVPFGAQTIDASSCWPLPPGASFNVYSDGANLHIFGNKHGPFELASATLPSSWAQYDLLDIYPDDFLSYELWVVRPNPNAALNPAIRVSVDSGTTFVNSGYATNGQSSPTGRIPITGDTVNSGQYMWSNIMFSTPGRVGPKGYACPKVAVTGGDITGIANLNGGSTRNDSAHNAIRIIADTSFFVGGSVKLFAFGRAV